MGHPPGGTLLSIGEAATALGRRPVTPMVAALTTLIAARGTTSALPASSSMASSSVATPSAALSSRLSLPVATATAGNTAAPAATSGPGGCSISTRRGIPAAGAAVFVCVTMSGEVTASGGFEGGPMGDSTTTGCRSWVAGQEDPSSTTGGLLLSLPDPGPTGGRVSDQLMSFGIIIEPYQGPGRYSATMDILTATFGTMHYWRNDQSSGSSATIDANGSGMLTISHMRDQKSYNELETITETWTCAYESGA